jgi:hypothetical protein
VELAEDNVEWHAVVMMVFHNKVIVNRLISTGSKTFQRRALSHVQFLTQWSRVLNLRITQLRKGFPSAFEM